MCNNPSPVMPTTESRLMDILEILAQEQRDAIVATCQTPWHQQQLTAAAATANDDQLMKYAWGYLLSSIRRSALDDQSRNAIRRRIALMLVNAAEGHLP